MPKLASRRTKGVHKRHTASSKARAAAKPMVSPQGTPVGKGKHLSSSSFKNSKNDTNSIRHAQQAMKVQVAPSPTRTPTNGKQWVAGADGVLDYAKIEAAIARGRQPQARRMCKQWGHGTGNCPGN